jgi:hypothetical protein
MTGNDPHSGGKLWIMPAILELFGASSVLKAYDTFDVGKPWYVWIGYAATGIVFQSGGILWAVFRKRLAELWPWHQLRVMRAELSQVLQERSELRERSDVPSPVQSRLIKPQHNVQCIGFKFITEADFPLSMATLCFQNVPTPGKLMGKFEYPRLRVIYYANSTGQEIAEMCPLQWYGNENGPNEITAEVSHAEIATFLTAADVWRLFEVNEPSEDFDDWHKLHFIEVPAGEYRIIAMLSGSYGLNIPDVTGVLTLGEDGTASFQRASD